MKILATSDIHENLPESFNELSADILIICGDLCLKRKTDYYGQANFINNIFDPWCKEMKKWFSEIIVIAGNHDVVFEVHPNMITPKNYIYLQDNGITIDGVNFWGTPWTVPFFDWGFNGRDHVRKNAFDLIPDDVDVLISHGPPRIGSLDVVKDSFTGDTLLNSAILRTQPLYTFCGHIHEGKDKKEMLGITEIYNVSYVDERYRRSQKGHGYAYIKI